MDIRIKDLAKEENVNPQAIIDWMKRRGIGITYLKGIGSVSEESALLYKNRITNYRTPSLFSDKEFTSRQYIIECESEEEAVKLFRKLSRKISSYHLTPLVELSLEEKTVFLKGKVTEMFHRVMIKHFITVEEEKED